MKMQYAGFWPRLAAGFIDFMVFIPVIALYLWLRSLSWEVAAIITIPNAFLYSLYNIYFHGRWGQTIGKMAVRIRVVLINGSAITLRNAFMRHSVDFVFSMLSSVAWMITVLSISKATFESMAPSESAAIIVNARPAWGVWVEELSFIWVLSELVVLLFNKKKRAIHDFIAGTVVTRLASV
jgi:uncharacterized RDD family membrane protein YckC